MHTLNVAQIVPATRAEGPGLRMAIWLQGCPLRCPDCCNPEMLPMEGGRRFPVAELESTVKSACENGIEGITLLGGEPFAQADGAGRLAEATREVGLTVMCFTGFTLAQLEMRRDLGIDRLLRNTDLLVDGPYVREKPDRKRRWIGSTNQQIHFLSDRYRPDDRCWKQPNTVELRFVDGEVLVNGFPTN